MKNQITISRRTVLASRHGARRDRLRTEALGAGKT